MAAALGSQAVAADSNAAITTLLGGASQQLQLWRTGMDAGMNPIQTRPGALSSSNITSNTLRQ